jgi:hypothetical protein
MEQRVQAFLAEYTDFTDFRISIFQRLGISEIPFLAEKLKKRREGRFESSTCLETQSQHSILVQFF